MELVDLLQLVGGAVQLVPAQRLASSRVFLHFIGDLRRQPAHHDVAELVRPGNGVVVQGLGRRQPARRGVVRKRVHLVLRSAVLDVVERVLVIAHVDTVAACVERGDESGDAPELALAQQLLLAQIVEAQDVAHGHQQLVLEGEHGGGDTIDGRLVQQRQAPAALQHLVEMDEPARGLPRVEREASRGAHHHHGDARQLGEGGGARRERGFVALNLERVRHRTRLGVHQLHARRPVALRLLARPKLLLGSHGLLLILLIFVLPVNLHGLNGLCLVVGARVDGGRGGGAPVVRLHHRQARAHHAFLVRRRGQLHKLAGSVPELAGRLVERLAQALHGDDAQRGLRDGHHALRALLACEGGGVLQGVIRKRCLDEPARVHIAQPRARGQRQHGLLTAHSGAKQLGGARSQEAGARVRQLTRHAVYLRAKQHTVLQTHVEEERRRLRRASSVLLLRSFTKLGVEHEEGLGRSSNALRSQQLKAVVWVQTQDAHCIVKRAHCQETSTLAALWDRRHVEASDFGGELLLVHFYQLARHLQLKVHDLPPAQRQHHLPVVCRHLGHRLAAGCLPLVHALVRTNVTQPPGMRLHEGVVAEQADPQRRGCA
mmetsp:Transcript_46564/g.88909  ORF Transcript_46564/g.88909 Transcript_46564/m.88909 type:complete len:602 (+) Transcript_46564:1576-3381(+)